MALFSAHCGADASHTRVPGEGGPPWEGCRDRKLACFGSEVASCRGWVLLLVPLCRVGAIDRRDAVEVLLGGWLGAGKLPWST